ncbi:hypothetical protein GCM10018785_60550 [Streptomyces longispororuber]|uniref:Uncharacterized protein n=1 Tax=Streptomyces longispororuber TaxID=68230 RepID=A0A919A3C4_9ACTN|nr:hypothetical protein GCM10018785_60550 [Streptomyces longispororuber]
MLRRDAPPAGAQKVAERPLGVPHSLDKRASAPVPATFRGALHVIHAVHAFQYGFQYGWPWQYQDRRSAGRTGCWLPGAVRESVGA